MIKIPIAIIGAGGMGGRHLRALGALYESGMANVELVAVCDKRKENAIYLADNAYEILGKRPKIFAIDSSISFGFTDKGGMRPEPIPYLPYASK